MLSWATKGLLVMLPAFTTSTLTLLEKYEQLLFTPDGTMTTDQGNDAYYIQIWEPLSSHGLLKEHGWLKGSCIPKKLTPTWVNTRESCIPGIHWNLETILEVFPFLRLFTASVTGERPCKSSNLLNLLNVVSFLGFLSPPSFQEGMSECRVWLLRWQSTDNYPLPERE